ncbi:MAG TPA: LLM class flavin-dependent oxidoreductase [Acidimicrobiia bacterium]|nr:LLM class flavin-dependent oxidoreductase [Acidimicrobiia bacterium]
MAADSDVRVWFGLFLPQLRMSFETILERTLAAEAAGFDSVWLMDHLAAPAAPEWDTLEGWTLAAGLATRTSRIRLGHLVTSDPFRHPAVLAKMAATLDVLSDGRLELGLGWGSVDAELRTFGIDAGPAPERASRLRETLEILPRMFTGEPFDYTGEHYELAGAVGRPVPVQQRIPVHIGGAGPKLTMPLVREFADWWNCPSYAADRLAEVRPLAGDARVSVQHPVGLAEGDGDRDEVAAIVARRFGSWGGVVAGAPAQVADALVGDVELGARGFVLQFHDFGATDTLERFMTDVAPAVRAAAAG